MQSNSVGLILEIFLDILVAISMPFSIKKYSVDTLALKCFEWYYFYKIFYTKSYSIFCYYHSGNNMYASLYGLDIWLPV